MLPYATQRHGHYRIMGRLLASRKISPRYAPTPHAAILKVLNADRGEMAGIVKRFGRVETRQRPHASNALYLSYRLHEAWKWAHFHHEFVFRDAIDMRIVSLRRRITRRKR